MTTFTHAIYGLFGASALIAGTVALVVPSLAVAEARPGTLSAHLVREQAAGFIFIGLMFFWCLRHFEQRRPVHLGLLAFTTLFALIHWADYLRSFRYILPAMINTLPALALAVTARFQPRQQRLRLDHPQ